VGLIHYKVAVSGALNHAARTTTVLSLSLSLTISLIQKLRNDNNSQLHPTQQDRERESNCSQGYVSLLPSACGNASHPDSCPLPSLSVDHARILAHHVKIKSHLPIHMHFTVEYHIMEFNSQEKRKKEKRKGGR
jgi:hypothetical protein